MTKNISNGLNQKDKILSIFILLLLAIFLSFFVYVVVDGINVFKIIKNVKVVDSQVEKEYELSSLLNDAIKGIKDARVSIYCFLDFEADDTKNVVETINQVLQKYPNNVNFVWKDFRLSNSYYSQSIALAARCAGSQDKYWDFVNIVLDNPTEHNLAFYTKTATDLKISTQQFIDCYNSKEFIKDIEYNYGEANVLDVKDSPTIFINQLKFDKEVSFENLDGVIKTLIK